MARKTTPTATADQSSMPEAAAPVEARFAGHVERDGRHYPALLINGTETRRKGSILRVTLDGTVYAVKVHGTTEADGETRVETDGVTPEK